MNRQEIEVEAKKFREHRATLRPAAQKKVDLIESRVAEHSLSAQLAVNNVWRAYRDRELSLSEAQTQIADIWSALKTLKREAALETREVWTEYKKAMKVPFKYAGM